MVLNPYFNKFNFGPEQTLIQDLIVEAISIYGMNIYYIPRNLTNFDKLYQTDDQSTYTNAIQTEVYLQNIDGFQGDSNIFTKFGLEIRNSITVTMAKRTFNRVLNPITELSRPMEGDLIYFALNKACFQIKFVNNKEIFYPLGELPTFQMNCELFQYSDETFNTGIPEIDSIQQKLSLNILDNVVEASNGEILTDSNGTIITIASYDPQNIDIDDDSDFLLDSDNGLVDFSTPNPFGQISKG